MRLALVLTMLGVLTLGPVTAAFATPPAGEGECVSPDTPVHEVLDKQELAALLQVLVDQLAVARPDLDAAAREQLVSSVLLPAAPQAAAAPKGAQGLADDVLAQYETLTVGQVAQLLAQATAALDVALQQVEDQDQADQIHAVFGAFVIQVLKALDFYDCDDDDEPTPAPSATETASDGASPDATASPGATASPAAYASASPESSTAGLADTGLGTPLLAALVAATLGLGAVLLGVTARPRAGR